MHCWYSTIGDVATQTQASHGGIIKQKVLKLSGFLANSTGLSEYELFD